jgi:hypothetical protein
MSPGMPVGRKLAMRWSMSALIWTTPRLTPTGAKLRTIVRTCALPRPSASGRPPSSRSTVGSCTTSCSSAPTTEAHASRSARGTAGTRGPYQSSAAIIAAFHDTGATYGRKNRRWLLSTPSPHADSTKSAAPGKRIRV